MQLAVGHDYLTMGRTAVENKGCDWGIVRVAGFADAPVSWGACEHGSVLGMGENDLVFAVFPRAQYWLRMAIGPHDEYS